MSKKIVLQIEYDGPSDITPGDVESAINYFMPGLYNSVKVSQLTPVADDGDDWPCPQCTTANGYHLQKCYVCGTPRA